MSDARWAMSKPILTLSVLLGLPACSDDGVSAPVGAAGSSSNAGTGGAAGASGSAAGSGGGGAAGTSGGSGGSGGVAAGPPAAISQTYSFTSSLEGFAVNYYCTAAGICASATQPPPAPVLADAGAADGGPTDAGADAGTAPFYELTLDPAVGSPDVGSARLGIQFNGPGQLVDFALNIPTVSLSNKLLRAQVRLEPGSPPATAKMYVKTGLGYVYADSGQVNLVEGTWVTLSFPNLMGGGYISNVVAFDPSDTREFGIEIGAGPTSLTPAVVHIDTVQY